MSTQTSNALADLLAGSLPENSLIDATLITHITQMSEALSKAGEAMGQLSQTMECPCCSAPRQARRQLPSAEFWSPQLVEDLRGGARAIRRLGWERGTWQSMRGVCALGGVMAAVSNRDVVRPDDFDPNIGCREWTARVRAVACAMREWIGGSLPAFNDRSATCGEEVIDELEACAAAVERALCRASERHGLDRKLIYSPAPRSSDVTLTVPEEWLTLGTVGYRVPEPV